MANALGFIMNALGIFVPIGLQAKYSVTANEAYTSVQIIAGSGGHGDSLGGSVPHVAIWNNNGVRVGQYHPNAGEVVDASEPKTIIVYHNQNGYNPADPYYVMLSNLENNGICLSAITVTSPKLSATFYGDTGYQCGQSWFLGQNKIGANFMKPKCVWLDADHTNAINARALSFHLDDMSPDPEKLEEYRKMPATLCHSTPRFAFWGNLLPDGVIPFFKPQLKYTVDQSNVGEGRDIDPQRVIDKPGEYNRAVYLHQGENGKRAARMPRRSVKALTTNHNPEHLIITDHPDDNVREVCEHPNSYGWDIASTVQNLYCDMEHKQLYYVCNGQTSHGDCFDLDAKIIVPKAGVNSTFVPHKAYTSVAHWEK